MDKCLNVPKIEDQVVLVQDKYDPEFGHARLRTQTLQLLMKNPGFYRPQATLYDDNYHWTNLHQPLGKTIKDRTDDIDLFALHQINEKFLRKDSVDEMLELHSRPPTAEPADYHFLDKYPHYEDTRRSLLRSAKMLKVANERLIRMDTPMEEYSKEKESLPSITTKIINNKREEEKAARAIKIATTYQSRKLLTVDDPRGCSADVRRRCLSLKQGVDNIAILPRPAIFNADEVEKAYITRYYGPGHVMNVRAESLFAISTNKEIPVAHMETVVFRSQRRYGLVFDRRAKMKQAQRRKQKKKADTHDTRTRHVSLLGPEEMSKVATKARHIIDDFTNNVIISPLDSPSSSKVDSKQATKAVKDNKQFKRNVGIISQSFSGSIASNELANIPQPAHLLLPIFSRDENETDDDDADVSPLMPMSARIAQPLSPLIVQQPVSIEKILPTIRSSLQISTEDLAAITSKVSTGLDEYRNEEEEKKEGVHFVEDESLSSPIMSSLSPIRRAPSPVKRQHTKKALLQRQRSAAAHSVYAQHSFELFGDDEDADAGIAGSTPHQRKAVSPIRSITAGSANIFARSPSKTSVAFSYDSLTGKINDIHLNSLQVKSRPNSAEYKRRQAVEKDQHHMIRKIQEQARREFLRVQKERRAKQMHHGKDLSTIRRATPEEVASERTALMDLFEYCDGPNWTRNDNWGSDKPLREWYGVGIAVEGHVFELNLANNNLRGMFPDSIAELPALEVVMFDDNCLEGELPEYALQKCLNLAILSARRNRLIGYIKFDLLIFLNNLREVWLSDNQLSGPLQPGLCALKNLTHLELDNNQLEGPIPRGLSKMLNLQYLSLGRNRLTGTIPSGLLGLDKLEVFSVYSNRLSGAVPSWLKSLPSLQQLLLFDNCFDTPDTVD